MNTTKRKGFTLVELLVVIAILAILATVSVVGYTAFIERAYVSNDENIAAQMNQYLVALKADSNGPFYGEEIDENNIWQVTDAILRDSNLGELIPQAAEYGYHFYYDLEEGKYVVMNDKDVTVSLATNLFGIFAYAEGNTYEVKPGNCFTQGNRYFFVDTSGSALATAVRGFYSFGDKTPEEALTEIVEAEAELPAVLYDYIEKTVFVTTEGNYVIDLSVNHENLFVHDDAVLVDNQKIDYTGATENITESDPLVTVNSDTTIVIPEGVKLPGGSLYIAGSGKVTIVLGADSWTKELKDIVDADFTDENVYVKVGNTNYIIDGVKIHLVNDDGTKGEHVDTLRYNNPMSEFNIHFTNDASDNKVYNSTTNVGYVAFDRNQFVVEITGAKGTQSDDGISNYEVNWSVPAEYQAYVEHIGNGTFKFLKNPAEYAAIDDVIKVTATAVVGTDGYVNGEAPATQTFTINVVRLTGATLKLADKPWADSATLIHSGAKSYDVVISGTPSYVNKIDEIKLNEKISLSFSGASATTSGSTITTVGAGTGTLTVNVGGYYSDTIEITICDTSAFTVTPKQSTIYLGNQNALTFEDLFNGTAPAGAEIRVCDGVYEDDNYMNWERDYLPDEDTKTNQTTFYVEEANVPVGDTIQFYGVSGAYPITLAVYLNGVRISDDITTVHVVDAVNIREYVDSNDDTTDDLTGNLNTSNALTNSVVLLADITMSGTVNYFEIGAGKTFYGNYNKFDVEAGRQANGIITLKGTLQDTKIVGEVYPECVLSRGSQYGSSIVCASGSYALVDNCYIANGRAPIQITGGPVTIKDSVLFGGRYANIDLLSNGKLVIDGTVTTIQTLVDYDSDTKVIGVGLSTWFDDNQKTVSFTEGADLIQYNFLDSDIAGYLPEITINLADAGINFDRDIPALQLAPIFNQLFASTYSNYHFTDDNGKIYVNSGMTSIDKHFNSLASASISGSGLFGAVKKNDTVTFKFTPSITKENASFVIEYNNTKFYESTDDGNTTDGKCHITTNLTKGQEISFTFKVLKDYVSADVRSGDFKIVDDTNLIFNTLVIDDSNLATPYEHTVYPFTLTDTIQKLAISIGVLDSKGLHHMYLDIDVYTPDNEDEDNNDRLEEYITYVVTGKYNPGIYDFDENGKLPIYTVPEED